MLFVINLLCMKLFKLRKPDTPTPGTADAYGNASRCCEPPNRQGAALFNQCIDLLNHWFAAKIVSGLRLELARCRWQ